VALGRLLFVDVSVREVVWTMAKKERQEKMRPSAYIYYRMRTDRDAVILASLVSKPIALPKQRREEGASGRVAREG